MSQRCAGSRSSGRIEDLAVGEDVVPAKRVPDEILLNDIHSAAKQSLELLFHLFEIVEVPSSTRRKHDENVHVTVGPKVVPEYRTEE